MDDIIIEDIINNRGKSHGELAVRIWMPKKFSKKVEVRGGIRKFKFGAINGEKMKAMPKFSKGYTWGQVLKKGYKKKQSRVKI